MRFAIYTDSQSRATAGVSQARWLTVASSIGHGSKYIADQLAQAPMYSASGVGQHDDRIRCWRWDVLAAEARKAESASDVARRILRLPSLIGRLACSRWMSERSELVMLLIPSRNRLSKTVRDGCPAHGILLLCRNIMQYINVSSSFHFYVSRLWPWK